MPPDRMVLNKLETFSEASSSLATSLVDSVSALSVGADSKQMLPAANLADGQMNFSVGYSSRSAAVDPEGRKQPFNSGFAYLKRCNGISGSCGDQGRFDSPKRQTNRGGQANHGWPSQNELADSRGQSGGRPGRSTELRTNADVAHSRRNDVKWTALSDKRVNSHDAQRQNVGERKSVKILQRPSSVNKILGHGSAEQGSQDEDASTAMQPKKGRKKTLSLNPDELEDLEILIEQVLKDGIEETNTDSEDDDEATEAVAASKGVVNEGLKATPEKLSVNKNSDKAERESRMEMVAKNTVIRNETGSKGRKFVKEMGGKNMGRGKDQGGRRRENPRAKDSPRSGAVQPRRVNEVLPPAPALVEDDRAKQSMANVYPAQLKVALKHMDALPPRFQRRLQTGMGQISGSDPALSRLVDEISPPMDGGRSSSSFGCKDGGDKSARERGSKKSIRNLLNDLALYDDEVSAMPAADPFPRRLSYSSDAVGEHGALRLLNAPPGAPLQISYPDAEDDVNKPVNIVDPFRSRHPPSIFQQKPVDKMFMVNGSFVADHSDANPLVGYGKDLTRWNLDGSASPHTGARKTTFSVNAPEFVSTMFPPSNRSPGGDSREGGHHTIPGSLEAAASLGFVNDASHVLANQPLSPNMINYQNNIVHPDYASAGASRPLAQYPMMPGVPSTIGRNMTLEPSYGPMLPSGSGFPPRQRFVGMNMVPYASVPVPYNASCRGYVPHQQVLMSPSLSGQGQQYAGGMQMADQQMTTAAAGELNSMQWISGGAKGSYMSAPSNQLDAGLCSVTPGSAPYGAQMAPDGPGGWPSKAFFQQPVPFEVGRQRIMRHLGEGHFVMVILVGHLDGNKLSMFSELQSSTTGSFVLNLRNGICPLSEDKVLEMHQWNYKMAMEAIDAQKNPLIIDHPFAQQWQLRDYIGLAHVRNYFVEIVDCGDGTQFRGIQKTGSYFWDEWQLNANAPPRLAVDEGAPPVGPDRYNIPSVMNSVYYLPSASAPSSLASQHQPLPAVHGDQMTASSAQNVALAAPNV